MFAYSVALVIIFLTTDSFAVFVKDINAGTTCGHPPEQYFKSWQADLLPKDRIPFICNGSDTNKWHPPHFMVDNDIATYWQSSAGNDQATIIVDLRSPTQKHLNIHNISIAFGSSQRPGQIWYLKSTDDGLSYTSWHYYVTNPYECNTVFNTTFTRTPFKVDTVLCTMFTNFFPKSGNETVSVDLVGGRKNTEQLEEWTKVTHIQIRFSGLHQLFDKFSHRWHHYNVREVKIFASCDCNDHASQCFDANGNGSYQCLCGNNACGDKCQYCCPLFNQKPWKKGGTNSFDSQKGYTCEACNCHNHSDVCVYNQTVADLKLSLDAHSNFSGGGVCLNCKHNTTGINCEKCRTYFFRPPGVDKTKPDVCHPCNCSISGVELNGETPNLDCVRDESAIKFVNTTSGDCFCKTNVLGPKCNACKLGFFNLTYANPFGCQPCGCDVSGTVAADERCGSKNGECNCKRFTIGSKCNSCLNGFFNLTVNNYDGCEPCKCNLGGSVTDVCAKSNGYCTCHVPEIYGSKCQYLRDGYFYPSLHFIKDPSLSISNLVVKAWRGMIEIPDSYHSKNIFQLLFSCTAIKDISGVVLVYNRSVTYTRNVEVKQDCVECMVLTTDLQLYPGMWTVEIMFPSITIEGIVTCRSVTGLPEEFYNPKSLDNRDEVLKRCDVIRNNVSDSICQNAVYTMTMDYLHQPFSCRCNSHGSLNSSCEFYMGQCFCKIGVTGRMCDKCQDGFYNISSNGCTPCDCFSSNKICDSITGQCVCPPHTFGKKCNSCASSHWNLTSHDGCSHCNCSNTGAMNGQCDVFTGQCDCRKGVETRTCTQCIDGFTNFSANGCLPCNCSMNGSLSDICDKHNSQCPCKNLTTGRYCDECKHNAFYLSSKHHNGCLECTCSGKSDNCSMAVGSFLTRYSDVRTWNLVSSTTNFLNVYNETRVFPNKPVIVLTAAIPKHNGLLYWTSDEDFLEGSAVATYGGQLQFFQEVEIFLSNPAHLITQKVLLQSDFGLTLEHRFPLVPFNQITNTSVTLTEDYWNSSFTGKMVSRRLFLAVLSHKIKVLISASPLVQSNIGYAVRIGLVSFTKFVSDSTASQTSMVENCTCPVGYSGLSCEGCSPGYFHISSNISYHGLCVKCRCNQHSDKCDRMSGVCRNCQHNTTGNHCEKCLPGFYGNTTLGTTADCRICPCTHPSAASNLCQSSLDGTVQCLNCSKGFQGKLCETCSLGYFRLGSKCVPCDCNNNSVTCDADSGFCDNCLFNTSGKNCEVCKPGWFGDAKERKCQACGCFEKGSVSGSCNKRGECTCLKNVIGKKCSTCMANSFNMNNVTGCKSCDCNMIGSVHPQCNDTGHCNCRNNATGLKCDRCINGLWGLPRQNCDVCNCNSTGAFNNSCSTISGQCFCKYGVGSRQCGSCIKQHTNFSMVGCDACPNCTQLLQRKIDELASSLSNFLVHISELKHLHDVDNSLNKTQHKIVQTYVSKQRYMERLNALSNKNTKFYSSDLLSSSMKVNMEAEQLQMKIPILLKEWNSETKRLQNLSVAANAALNLIRGTNITTKNSVLWMNSNVETSHMFLVKVQKLTNDIKGFRMTAFTLKGNLSKLPNLEVFLINGTRLLEQLTRLKRDISDVRKVYGNVAGQQNQLHSENRQLKYSHKGLYANYTDLLSSFQLTKNITSSNIDSIKHTKMMYESIHSEIKSVNLSTNVYKVINMLICCNNISLSEMIKHLNQSIQTTVNDFSLGELLRKTLVKSVVLNETAKNISHIFNLVEDHHEKTLASVNLLNSLKVMMNQSMSLSALANHTFEKVQSSLLSKERILMNVYQEKLMSESVLRDTYTMWLAINDLSKNITKLNVSLNNYEDNWQNIKTGITDLQSMSTYVNTSEKDLLMDNGSKVDSISEEVGNTIRSMNQSGIVTSHLTERLNDSAVNNLESNQKMVLIESQNKIIDKHLQNSSTIMTQISQSVNHSSHFNITKDILDYRLIKLRKKLEMIRQTLSEVGWECNRDTQMQNITLEQRSSSFMQLEISLKTKAHNASILRVIKQDEQVTLAVKNSFISVNYQTHEGQQEVTNWEVQVSDNRWKKIEFSRMNNSSRLTVTSLNPFFSRTYGSFTSSINRLSPYNSTMTTTTLQIGKWRDSNLQPYVGCLANLKVNNEKKRLSPLNFSNVEICQSDRSHDLRVPGASFFGRGFVKQKMDNFSVIGDFHMKLKFRTFKENASVLTIKGVEKNILLAIQLTNGHVALTIIPNRTSSLVLNTNSGQYNDGHWYLVDVSVVKDNISMTVHNGTKEEKNMYPFQSKFSEDGAYIYLGGVDDDHDDNRGSFHQFAGCLSHFEVSVEGVLTNRSLRGLTSFGVHFNGCYQQVDQGLHFFNGGFSNMTISPTRVNNISFVFKTAEASGTILSYRKKENYMYVALFHGNLFVAINDYVLYSNAETLNDRAYHVVHITLDDKRFEIDIDKRRVVESVNPAQSLPFMLEDYLIFGYNEGNFGRMLPVHTGFIGDFRSFNINEVNVLPLMFNRGNFLSMDEVVSPDIVKPTELPTLPPTTETPPTCAPLLALQFSSNTDWVGFSGSSLLALKPSVREEKQLLSFFNINFVITIEFRAFLPHGVIFFSWNANMTATQYIMLSLVDGHLVYEFDVGIGKVKLKTNQMYANGEWFKVYLIRISQFGAMLVSETQEYHNSMNGNSYAVMQLTLPLYLGNLPKEANSVFQNENGLYGCVRKLEVAETRRTFAMKFREHQYGNVTRNLRRCYVSVAPQVSFISNGYALVNHNVVLTSATNNISITFRAHFMDGVLWYLKGVQASLYLHMKQGKLELVEDSGRKSLVLLSWIDLSNVWSNVSYTLCDGEPNTVLLERTGNVFRMYVNGKVTSISVPLTNTRIQGTLFVGGSPGDDVVSFTGCIRKFIYNDIPVDFANVKSSHRMIYGCSQ